MDTSSLACNCEVLGIYFGVTRYFFYFLPVLNDQKHCLKECLQIVISGIFKKFRENETVAAT